MKKPNIFGYNWTDQEIVTYLRDCKKNLEPYRSKERLYMKHSSQLSIDSPYRLVWMFIEKLGDRAGHFIEFIR